MVFKQSTLQKCLFYEKGICHYLESALDKCMGICNMFKYFENGRMIDRFELEKKTKKS
jgi:hypothetical protein